MGFPLSDVLTESDLVEEFTCKICFNLVEYTHCSYTQCSHVFCEACLSDWQEHKSNDLDAAAEAAMNGSSPPAARCPTCNASLTAADATISSLKTTVPLAWRLLGRVKCRCPLHGSGCAWQGDYSEVNAHLTNSQSHLAGQDYSANAAQANAEALKDQGNAKFQAHAYREAIQLYSKAISAAPGVAAYYGNRGAAWLMVGAAKECADDCRRAISLDPAYAKGHLRLAKALCEMSDVAGAEVALQSAAGKCAGNKEISEELNKMRTLAALLVEGARLMAAGEPATALELYTQALRVTQCAAVTLGAARAETGLGRCDRAMRLTLQVIRNDPSNVQAYAVRGHALCLKVDFDQGMKHLKESLRLDPDHAEAQRLHRRMKRAGAALERGRAAVAKRDFDDAVEGFTESLDAADAPAQSPLAATALAERANAHLRRKDYDASLADCARAIASQEDHKPAYFTQATALLNLGKPQEAADSLELLLRMDPSDETVRRHHEKAVFEVRKSKRPDYYAILGISSVASIVELKQAYKARCMEWHPDRHATKSDEEKAVAEANFKALGEALEIMEDQMKRQLYDEGYDKEAIVERSEAARRAAHRGGCGSGGGGGGCGSGHC
jgi:DnaJ family protein C protein 7